MPLQHLLTMHLGSMPLQHVVVTGDAHVNTRMQVKNELQQNRHFTRAASKMADLPTMLVNACS